MWGIGRCSGSGFIVVFFILTITFCLVSAGIFKANTAITMDAYAKKSKDSSRGSRGIDSSDKGGDKSISPDNNLIRLMTWFFSLFVYRYDKFLTTGVKN